MQLRAASLSTIPRDGSFMVVATVTSDLSIKPSRVIGQSIREESGSLGVRVEQILREEKAISLRAPARLLTPSSFPELTPGTRIKIRVQALPKLGEIPLLKALGSPQVLTRPGFIASGAQHFRLGLREAAGHLPDRFEGLLPGLVDGDTYLLDTTLVQEMKQTNLTHLTAVSGANLALVAAFVLTFFRRIGTPRRLYPILSALSIAAFVVIARPDPSVMRAAVMAGVLIVASALDIPSLGLTSLMAAVVILVLFDPSQATKPGFVLSVLATAGILIFGNSWTARLSKHMPRWIAVSLATPLAAQALCTPYLVTLSGQLSLIGVWTNLVAGPAVAPATILGFVAGLISLVAPPLALVLAWCAAPFLWLISLVAHIGASLSFANVMWFGGAFGAVVAALLMVASYLLARRSPKALLTSYLCLLLVLAALRAFNPGWPMSNWNIAMCDVGQGDGLVIRADTDSAVVVDAGPDPKLIDQCLRDLRISTVALLVLTHNHADHVEGLRGIVRHRVIEQVWLSPEVEPVFESKRVEKWLAATSVSTVPIHQPFRTRLAEVEAWWPTERIAQGSIPNNASIVLSVKINGRQSLFLGDVEVEAQDRLLSQFPGRVDLLKVAHHGSANQSSALLQQLHPFVALISVGQGNPYGHPSPTTITRLVRGGAQVYRSDRDGAVAVAMDSRGIVVRRRGHPWWRQR